jgi:hypothetical protein
LTSEPVRLRCSCAAIKTKRFDIELRLVLGSLSRRTALCSRRRRVSVVDLDFMRVKKDDQFGFGWGFRRHNNTKNGTVQPMYEYLLHFFGVIWYGLRAFITNPRPPYPHALPR